MIERETGGADQNGLEPRASDHASAGHESAGADDVATLCSFRDHRVDDPGVEVVVRREYENERSGAGGESGQYGAVCAAAAVAYKFDG